MVLKTLDSTYNPQLISNVHVNKSGIESRVAALLSSSPVTDEDNYAAWLLKAISVIDLTTLAGDDTSANVQRLCLKACQPLSRAVYRGLGFEEWTERAPVTVAAVCVYPARASAAARLLIAAGQHDQVQVAAVATGFPSGLYALGSRLAEVRDALAAGACEVDVVVDRGLALAGRWREMYAELLEMRAACAGAQLKVILGVGELGTYTNIYKASMVSMAAGADFIKTSTGKEAVNATLAVGVVMCRAIRTFHRLTGRKVGLKAAGGIRTAGEAVCWLRLVREELGAAWLCPQLFRIGASGLLGDLERCLHERVTGELCPADRFSFI